MGRLLVDGEPVAGKGAVFRTGFVIDSCHVLTAAHCVRDVDTDDASVGRWWLRLPYEDAPADHGEDRGGADAAGRLLVPLRVADRDEGRLDAAVLRVDPDRESRPALGPDQLAAVLDRVAVALDITVDPQARVRAEGFPASAGNPNGRAFSGVISDGHARLPAARAGLPAVRALELFLDQAAAVSPEGPGGLSGGPVIQHTDQKAGSDTAAAAYAAVGVIRGFPKGEEAWQARGGTVYASRVDDLTGRFPVVADAVARRAQQVLDQAGNPRSGAAGSLIGLLRADAALTDFRGRTQERGQLRAWCDSPAPRSAWLIVGSAGQGKTRLARWLTDLAGSGGWLTALFRGPGDVDRLDTALTVAAHLGRGVLVVVDYAAEHGAASLHPLLERLTGSKARWRLLLLARATGDWWDSSTGVRRTLENAGTEVRDPTLTLTALEPTVDGRKDAFHAVVAALREPVRSFAENHRLPFVADPPVPSLARDEFGAALMLHVAAVCALLPASRPGEDGHRSPAQERGADLLGRLLDLERDNHWLYLDVGGQTLYRPTEEAFGSLAQGSDGYRTVEAAVAAATLAGAATLNEAVLVLCAALDLPDRRQATRIARWLHDLYPPAEDRNGWLPPLQPDLLGEELVARVIRQTVTEDGNPLTTTLPFRILQQPAGSQPTDDQVRRMLTVLSRAAPRHPLLARLLDGAGGLGGPSDSPVLACIPPRVDLAPVEAALPHSTTSLGAFAVQLTSHLLHRHLSAARPDNPAGQITVRDGAEAARLQNNLAIRLSGVGRRAEALAPATEAVTIRRRLAEVAPDAYLPDLAGSLTNLANRLSGVGRRAEALAPATEAVDLYRRLAEAAPDAYLPDLAMSLTNLANVLSGVGRRAEALAPATEAVDLYRRLVEAAPDAYLPNLAASLTTLANRLSEVGRRAEALAPATEAVTIRRRLVEAAPDAYLPDLAGSLTNLAVRLSGVGRRAEALAPATEAVDLYRRLAEAAPDAYLPDLAMSLTNLANVLSGVGRRAEALAPATEAVTIRRRLVEAAPDAYLPDLAGSLNTLALGLSEVGRRAEALAPATEAVELYRRLAEVAPDAYLPNLAASLTNLAIGLSEVGRRAEALAPATEAVTIRRRLAEVAPDAYLPDLAMSLTNLAKSLSEVGRRAEALAPATEAVDLYRRLVEAAPDAYLPDLAGSLTTLANRLSEVGRRAEALAPATEAVDLYRRLAEVAPDAYLPDLAGSLTNLAVRLSGVGRRAEALAPATEAVDLYRRLAEVAPDAYLPDLAMSLNNLAIRLSGVGRRAEALAPATEAVTIRRRLAEVAPDAYLPDLAGSLNTLAIRLSEVGRRAEALAPATEAVDLSRRLAEVAPDAYLPHLAASLNNLAAFLSEVGRRAEALAPATEAVDLYRRLAEVAPDAYLPNLAASLNTLATSLSEVGRRAEALAPATEAVTIRRRLAEVVPDAYLPDLAMSLTVMALVLRRVKGEDAVAAAAEAVEMFGVLAGQLPEVFGPRFEYGCRLLADLLDDVDRGEEAAEIRGRLAEDM
ncbi:MULTISPECIES: tetratricopeptide repeat protein [unclassified Frankia]|uniref:tetratricopeptide repeat protein n=1 Tax=unclassified Frankia TaxID=2632575 RepID=UPI002AD37004|nr:MULTISPECIES: tetratricopeptide repeat protein [unclassified Frankia]